MKYCLKLVISGLLLGVMYTQAFAISPNRVYRFFPEKLGLIYKDLEVTTSDGLQIKTWFFPAQLRLSEAELDRAWATPVKKRYTSDNKKHPTIIICNGDAGNMSYQQLAFVQYFTDKGYHVVTFDWRGFGQSSEWPMNPDYLVYSELLIDYNAVIKQVVQADEVDASKIAVFGWSTGAYLSMAASNKYSNIKCFVGIGLMTSFEEALPSLNRVPKNANRKLIIPSDYPKELQPLYLAPTYAKSTFLIVGALDDRAPVWMSEHIYKVLPGAKELWVVDEAEHTIINESPERWEQVNERIVEFLDRHLKNGKRHEL